jgi:hypothetical protein
MAGEPKNFLPLGEENGLSDQSYEIVRIWVTDGNGSHVWIAPYYMESAQYFGYLLADTASHGARAFASEHRIAEAEALQQIVSGIGEALREQFNKITTNHPEGFN